MDAATKKNILRQHFFEQIEVARNELYLQEQQDNLIKKELAAKIRRQQLQKQEQQQSQYREILPTPPVLVVLPVEAQHQQKQPLITVELSSALPATTLVPFHLGQQLVQQNQNYHHYYQQQQQQHFHQQNFHQQNYHQQQHYLNHIQQQQNFYHQTHQQQQQHYPQNLKQENYHHHEQPHQSARPLKIIQTKSIKSSSKKSVIEKASSKVKVKKEVPLPTTGVHGIDRTGHDYMKGEYFCVCGAQFTAKAELFDHIREMVKMPGTWISCNF